MTISPLMVELFPNWYDGPATAANWPRGHFYWHFYSRTSGAPFLRAMSACGVDHQSKRRDMKIKSTFNISFQIHFVCFVLKIFIVSWILLVVAFNCLLHDAAFCRKVGWWSCVMVTVLLKKEIGNNVSFSSIFLGANVNVVGLILNHQRGLLFLCAPGFYMKKHKWNLQILGYKHIILNSLFEFCTYLWKGGDARDQVW